MPRDIRWGVLTVSDRASHGVRDDVSGPGLVRMLAEGGWKVELEAVVSDDQVQLESKLKEWADSGNLDVILTTGGTGFSARDRAPEATLAAVERLAPGLAEAIRAASMGKTPHAMLSRGAAGIRGSTLIVNLPGSPRAARESLGVILPALPHAVELLRGESSSESGHAYRTPPSHA